MTEEKFFSLEHSPVYKEKYIIKVNKIAFHAEDEKKLNFNILIPRLLGWGYDKYLQFTADVLSAEVVGKESKCPIPLFEQTHLVYSFIKMLNSLGELFMSYREDPYLYKEAENKEIIKVEI